MNYHVTAINPLWFQLVQVRFCLLNSQGLCQDPSAFQTRREGAWRGRPETRAASPVSEASSVPTESPPSAHSEAVSSERGRFLLETHGPGRDLGGSIKRQAAQRGRAWTHIPLRNGRGSSELGRPPSRPPRARPPGRSASFYGTNFPSRPA